MGVIHLVRHGQADPSAYGVPSASHGGAGALTALGVRQARTAGAELRRRTDALTAAVSGDLPRQRQTLAHVLDRFAAPPAPIVDPGWNEYPMPATVARADAAQYADGRAYQELLDAGLAEWIARSTPAGPAAPSAGTDAGAAPAGSASESYAAFRARIREAADRAATRAGSGRCAVVVSSAGAITRLVAELWQVPDHRWPTLARSMVNASITTLIVGRRGLSVVTVNEHAHLRTDEHDLSTFR